MLAAATGHAIVPRTAVEAARAATDGQRRCRARRRRCGRPATSRSSRDSTSKARRRFSGVSTSAGAPCASVRPVAQQEDAVREIRRQGDLVRDEEDRGPPLAVDPRQQLRGTRAGAAGRARRSARRAARCRPPARGRARGRRAAARRRRAPRRPARRAATSQARIASSASAPVLRRVGGETPGVGRPPLQDQVEAADREHEVRRSAGRRRSRRAVSRRGSASSGRSVEPDLAAADAARCARALSAASTCPSRSRRGRRRSRRAGIAASSPPERGRPAVDAVEAARLEKWHPRRHGVPQEEPGEERRAERRR